MDIGINFNTIANTGAAKAAMPEWKSLVSEHKAGKQMLFPWSKCIATSNPGLQKLIMAMLFPVNLMMVTLCGAELYTGNTAVVGGLPNF
eukprot:990299-Pelagomonas_calceolata.AAC.2